MFGKTGRSVKWSVTTNVDKPPSSFILKSNNECQFEAATTNSNGVVTDVGRRTAFTVEPLSKKWFPLVAFKVLERYVREFHRHNRLAGDRLQRHTEWFVSV
jgi:hypothetical protein